MPKRTYAITGASSGIGAELARQLIARGDAVALIARRKERLDEVAAEGLAAAAKAGTPEPFAPVVLPADVLDRSALREALRTAEARLPGGVEVLVLNAGIGARDAPADAFDAAALAEVIDVNLTSTLFAIEAVLPGMLARGRGHIVGVSSIASARGLPLKGPYCASKAGFSALLESLRLDLRPRGIDVTDICPGFVKSELTAKNKHVMPFMLETDDAVRRMVRAMDRRKRDFWFPWPTAVFAKLLRRLPGWLYDFVGGRMRAELLRSRAAAGV